MNTISLQYDGFGRRTKNLQNTSFLFDRANAVQELSGSTPTANLISGGIDEIFTRADSTGAYSPLQDALGSTIALVDATGNLVTQYFYDPFGNTTAAGTTNSNAFLYTGRENEGNGLYSYRSRYYSPLLHRFISPDPLGFAGSGTNFYAYAGNDPIDFKDPFGLSRDCFFSSCGGLPKQMMSARGNMADPRPNRIECLAMDMVGVGVTCVQGPNGPIVTVDTDYGERVTIAYGGLNPPLKVIHNEPPLQTSASYQQWNQKSTEEIVQSLAPGNPDLELTVYPDGSLANGNTRITILQERGFDVNSLPRVPRIPPFEDPIP